MAFPNPGLLAYTRLNDPAQPENIVALSFGGQPSSPGDTPGYLGRYIHRGILISENGSQPEGIQGRQWQVTYTPAV